MENQEQNKPEEVKEKTPDLDEQPQDQTGSQEQINPQNESSEIQDQPQETKEQTDTQTPDLKEENKEQKHEKIFSIVVDKDEITWQSIIHDLIKSGEIDPWDVNISLLTKKYLEEIKKLQEHDLRMSGKVVLAAALLLKIKSNRLMGEDLANLDRMFSSSEEPEEDLLFEEDAPQKFQEEIPGLIPRTPIPRRRKVSIHDLVNALEQALEVKRRRVWQSMPPKHDYTPKKTKDISIIIKDVYARVMHFFSRNRGRRLKFSQLIPSETKEDKIFTFIPLLHLSNQRKIDLEQYQNFGEIEVMLRAKQEVEKEL